MSTIRKPSIANRIRNRSDIHNTTTMGKKHVEDPKGYHVTFSYKNDVQVEKHLHITSHAYTNGKYDFTLISKEKFEQRPDDSPRGGRKGRRLGRVIWPDGEGGIRKFPSSSATNQPKQK